MGRVAIVTDSSSCLPSSFIAEHGIIIVPLTVVMDGEAFRDGVLTAGEFYSRLRGSRSAPLTAAPAPGEFLQAFRDARDSGATSALCLTLDSDLSGTYSSAVRAEEMALIELDGFLIRVVDTRSVAMAHGFSVLAAARAASAGATIDEAAAGALAVAAEAHLVGVIETTLYLARSGRLPWVAHWAASLLHIRPLLAASAGKIRGIGRARTVRGAVERMIAYVDRRIGRDRALHLSVMHAEAGERADELAELVRRRFSPAELFVTEFTSVMGVHTGPGFVGLAFYSEAEPEE
jgi:DegV family protein with EDD domain